MRSYQASAVIDAEPAKVWTALVDGPSYPTMREEFTGPLLPPIGRSMPDLGPSFGRFANGLKQRVETAG